jgi:hypothetical protein
VSRPRIALPDIATIVPIREVAKLLDSTREPIRKASIETLAALSRVAPSAMAFLIPRLHALLADEPQNALANHAIEILANYAKTSRQAARKVIPIFRNTIAELRPKSAAKVGKILAELTKK